MSHDGLLTLTHLPPNKDLVSLVKSKRRSVINQNHVKLSAINQNHVINLEKEKSARKRKRKQKRKKEEPASTSESTEQQQQEEEEEQTSSFDALGDEESDDEAQAAIDAIAAAKHAKDAAAGKKAVIARSTLILDVKPEGSETDMAELEKDVRAIAMEGLVWAGSELVPVAYGVKKLRIISVIVDDLVSTDELREKIEELEGVQSTDIFAFNKV